MMPRSCSPLRASLRHAVLGAAVASLATVARPVPAQSAAVELPNPRHLFEDSWYWGAKGGVARFGTSVDGRVSAPLAGAEWLVTHRRGALLVSAEQSFFDRVSTVADRSAAAGTRTVSINDARRYSFAALAAPVAYGPIRPYAGLGLALQVIRRATPTGVFATREQQTTVREAVDDGQSAVAPFVMAGAQAQLGPAALFVQGSLAAARTRSLLNQGGAGQLEAGLRFNVASAFDW